MSALFTVELRRLLSRRLLHALSMVTVAAISLAGVLTFLNSDASPEAMAAYQSERRAAIQSCVEGGRENVGDPSASSQGRDARSFCEEEVWVESPAFDYSELKWILMSLGVPMIMLGWLIGASFIGAEWAHRTLASTFTWEPRRAHVLAGKAAALAVVVFVWISMLQFFLAAALAPAGVFRGVSESLDASFWSAVSVTILRVSALGAVAAIMGFSLSTIGKNTAAALGVGFVQLAVVEGLIRGFKPAWTDWLIGDNVALFLAGSGDVNHLGHSQAAAGLLLAAYALLLLAAGHLVLRKREMA